METLDKYLIDLKNLSVGKDYEFEYLLENEFFQAIDDNEIRQGKVNAILSVLRVSTAFELNFHLEGEVVVTCDRCLDDMKIPVETDNRLVVTFGETYAEMSDERVVVPEDEGTINVAWYMYEFIALALPMKRVHEVGKCNEAMAAKLREISVDDISESYEPTDSDSENKQTDPRWDALRKLK